MSQSPMPDSSWKGLPSWLFFAFLAFGPPAALVAFTRTVTQSPLLITLIVLGYWILLFLGHLARKIWQQLEEPFTGHIAQWLTSRAQEMTSRYYRQYSRYIVAEHQVFDVKGLSTRAAHDLVLEQVFVDLHVHPQPPHRANADPIHLPESLQGPHSIWEYLSNPTLANPHLVVLGAPGSGKTTLLKHLALTLAQPKRSPRRLRSHSFPILLFLRDHAQAIMNQSTFSLANAVEEHVQRKWQQTIPASWIHRYLEQGKGLVLLDGLDEVADCSTRKIVAAWVGRQLLTYGKNRFVLTSRPYGYRENPLDGVTVLEVQTFTSDQVKQFIQNWYQANELKSWGKDDLSVQLHAREGTQDLLRRLHQTPALLALAVNPLLLTMIATVHRYRGSLPSKRVHLYAEICEVFLGKRHEARGITHELSPAQKQQVLQLLAYWLMRHGGREVTRKEALQVIEPTLAQVNAQIQATDFLQHIEDTSGLFLEKNPSSYGFAHLTFQEYLAAVHIKEEGEERLLVDQVTNSWWHETIRLYCAQADATAVIQACLAGSSPKVEALILAFECDEEKLKLQPRVQAQLDAILNTNLEDADSERLRMIAEVLLTRRLHRMLPLQEGRYIDTSLITCAEYQLFLNERQAQGHYHQPDHWRAFSFPQGSANMPVMGIRRSDAQAFCMWLTAREKEGWRYRLPRTGEWSLKERAQWKALHAEMGYWTEDNLRFEWVQDSMPLAMQQHLEVVLAHTLAGLLDSALAQGLAHPTVLDLDNLLDNAHILKTRAIDITHALRLASNLALTRVRVRDRVRDITHALRLASDFVRALDSDLTPARARTLVSSLSVTLAQVSTDTLAKTSTRTRIHVLDHILANVLVRIRALNRVSRRSLALADALNRLLSRDRASTNVLNHAFTCTLTMLITIRLLQERIDGNFSACEGLLLVKEYQRESEV